MRNARVREKRLAEEDAGFRENGTVAKRSRGSQTVKVVESVSAKYPVGTIISAINGQSTDMMNNLEIATKLGVTGADICIHEVCCKASKGKCCNCL